MAVVGPLQPLPDKEPSSEDDETSQADALTRRASGEVFESLGPQPSSSSTLAGRIKAGLPGKDVAQGASYATALDAWAKDDSIKGDKSTAVRKIQEALTEGATELDLSRLELTHIPPLGPLLPQLTKLSINNNALTSLPSSELAQMTVLEELEAGNNQITEVPAQIGKMPNLKILDLSDNRITTISPSIAEAQGLRAINLSNNALSELPAELCELPELTGLALSDNQLERLPDNLDHLTSLEFLDLSGNNLKHLPADMGSLTHLERLNVADNRELSELPASLSTLPTPPDINCEGTQITTETSAVESDVLESDGMESELELSSPTGLSDIEQQDVSEASNSTVADVVDVPAEAPQDPLHEHLSVWYALAGRDIHDLDFSKFTDTDKPIISEWLERLERTPDFQGNQRILAGAVCDILQTAAVKEDFKNDYVIPHMEANNADCENRAAMAINNLYLGWRLTNLPPTASRQQKLEMLVAGAKTLTLHNVIDQRLLKWQQDNTAPPPGESVELHLYFENLLREPLKLLSISQDIAHPRFAEELLRSLDISLDGLKREIELEVSTSYVDHLVPLASFQELVTQDPTFRKELASRLESFETQQEELEIQESSLLTKAKQEGIKDPDSLPDVLECRFQQAQLMKTREQAKTDLMKEWFLEHYQV